MVMLQCIYEGCTKVMISRWLLNNARLLQCAYMYIVPSVFSQHSENHAINFGPVFIFQCGKMVGKGMSFQ
jgi:hypothetical protein